MKVFVDKLIDITRYHAEEISKDWTKVVRTNPRTPSYHSIPEDLCTQQARDFYKNLRQIFFSEKPYKEINEYFSRYAKDRYKEGIPLHEAVYALIMMRRQLWLYADFQGPFLTGLNKDQVVDTINRTIRIFDHGIYIIIRKYGESPQER